MAEYRIFFRKSVWQDIEKIPNREPVEISEKKIQAKLAEIWGENV